MTSSDMKPRVWHILILMAQKHKDRTQAVVRVYSQPAVADHTIDLGSDLVF